MLGRLRMSVDSCIEAYLKLPSGIFQKQRHRLTLGGKFQGRFDSEGLEQAVKEILVSQGLNKDALMLDEGDCKCNV